MNLNDLKKHTQARILLSRSGAGIGTKDWLSFSYSHASAKDAIFTEWNKTVLTTKLNEIQLKTKNYSTNIKSREEYLQRPDLGRRLNRPSEMPANSNNGDVLILVSNGLSSEAVNKHAFNLIMNLKIKLSLQGYKVINNTVYLVENGRVALSDDLGSLYNAKMVICIIGERPGLSSIDSLAIYLTMNPNLSNNDANRNCISNIRPPHGLSYSEATHKCLYLMNEAYLLGQTGYMLKDNSETLISNDDSIQLIS